MKYLTDGDSSLPDEELEGLLELAVSAAKQAGTLVTGARKDGVSVATTKSNELDVVTQADLNAENLIKSLILAQRPDDGFLGEETADVGTSDGITWLVDPIDGTVNYLYDEPGYVVSVAAYLDSTPLVGAVYNPGMDELWAAKRGGGATRNGTLFRTEVSGSAERPLLGTVFGYRSEMRSAQMRRLANSASTIRDVRVSGSTALDLCRVAAGRIDVFCTDSVNWWDVAAGVLIAREAGCRVWAHQDLPEGMVSCMASNPGIPDEVLSSLGYAEMEAYV